MIVNPSTFTAHLWSLCNVLRGDGIGYNQYLSELTYLLFLKLAKETKSERLLPNGYRWDNLAKYQGTNLLGHYQELLTHLWAELRPMLKALSHGKCWYTEAPQQGTDVDVDHFRPKRRVAELAGGNNPHPGYWWLAFDPSNYRYSCIVANRRRRDLSTGRVGGKADAFPIQDEAQRANSPDADYDAEKPLLIDPCVDSDTRLIAYKADGEAMPRFPISETYKHAKANKSIDLYSINHSDFVKARLELLNQLERLCSDARRYFRRLEDGDADHERGYRRAIAELSRLRSSTQPFSAFCSAMIERYRHEDYLFGLFPA